MSTSRLQRFVSSFLNTYFAQYIIRENYRPEWLSTENGGNLELDFYIEELCLAVEVQGEQHHHYVPHFHKTPAGFNKQLQDDEYKKLECSSRGIQLIEIFDESDILDILKYLVGRETTLHNNAIGDYLRAQFTLDRRGENCLRQLKRAKARGDIRKVHMHRGRLYHRWLKQQGITEQEFEAFYRTL